MKPQVQEAIEAELLKRAKKDLRHVAVTMVREGPGVIVNEPLRTSYDEILHRYADRNSILGSDEVPPASAAFNRARYALRHFDDLGPETLVRSLGDLWREGGGTCVRKDVAEEALVNQMMIGTPGQPKIEAAKLLSTTCGTLTPSGGRVAIHGMGAFAGRLKKGHEYKPVGAELAGIDLREVDLTGAILARADMRGARLSRADLSGADLTEADLSRATLSDANLSSANLSRARLTGDTILSRANLSGANLSGALLSRAAMSCVNLAGANFSGANLSGANLSGANLSGVKLSGAELSGADLSGANLSDADLTDMDLTRVNFSGANLTNTNLTNTRLCGVQLSGLDLSSANLFGANLSGAKRDENDISGWRRNADGRLERV